MSELGELLRKARLDKGISLDTLQDTTKIRKRYLEAIEEGNYKVMPGSFYVRAFIKSYAEAVGLDPNEVLRLYKSAIPAPAAEPKAEPQMRRKRTDGKSSEKWSKWATGIMLWSFLLLIIGIIYYFISTNYKSGDEHKQVSNDQAQQHLTTKVQSETQAPQTGASATPETSKAPSPTPTPTPQQVVKLTKSEKGVDYYSVQNADKVKLEMKITGDECWYQVDRLADASGQGAKNIDMGTIVSGAQPKTWEVDGSTFLILGRANAVEISVNGNVVPVGDLPNAKRFRFDLVKT